jgi:hypothetical protein
MKWDSISRAHVEAMGLRLESTRTLRPLDALIDLSMLLSGAVWIWVAFAGPDPALTELIGSRLGRVGAALIGGATAVGIVKSLRYRADS